MKLVRYSAGAVSVVEEPAPSLPPGGLLVRTEACGLCSGELMAWYMDAKTNPVLGHEVAGRVIESDDPRFPVGCRVFPHHHAPCGSCAECRRGAFVQCATWRRTRLEPGGMAEIFAVAPENLADTHRVDELRAVDTALAEPLACVMKSLRQARWEPGMRASVIGLGGMGLLHMLALGPDAAGYEINDERIAHARSLGLSIGSRDEPARYDTVFVCPGSQSALELAFSLVAPRGTILLFAPFGTAPTPEGLIDRLYFNDVTLATSYSAGPDDIEAALELLRSGRITAESVVSDFVGIDDMPAKYQQMKRGEILKAMVRFDHSP
ncbi:MAG TPA: alcohol dehydrogenase catalytic domain-containing protein [Fimbriimonadaceae bacterium]|nr:alcohol dehydrogenase catalytic domain-containing protein [Fimbriimonadaceae bacterium]